MAQRPRYFLRWLPTLLAFPLGGLLAARTVGPVDGAVTALLAGALAGAIIGAAQWLALRPARLGTRWIVLTSVAMALGVMVATLITDAGTSTPDLVLTGLIAGAVVGAVQGVALGGGPRTAAIWTAAVSLAWGAGWWVTANVIVDAESGYVSFGSSGALVATVITGVVVQSLLAGRQDGGHEPASPARAEELQ